MYIEFLTSKAKRKNNEDSALLHNKIYSNENFLYLENNFEDNECLIFAVADGVGGGSYGEIASKQVLEGIREHVVPRLKEIEDIEQCEPIIIEELENIQNRIDLYEQRLSKNMGSTISLLILYEGRFFSLNIGDSPMYYLNGKSLLGLRSLEEIYYPQTEENRKLESGIKLRNIPNRDRHTLTQSFGYGGFNDIFTLYGNYYKNDTFYVMSDGMFVLGERRLKKLRSPGNLIYMKRKINKSKDNATAIIIHA